MSRVPRLLVFLLVTACSVKPIALTGNPDGGGSDQSDFAEAASPPPDTAPLLPDAAVADAVIDALAGDLSLDVPAPAPDLAGDVAAADRRIPPDFTDPIELDPDAAALPPDLAPDVATVPDAASPPDVALAPDLAPADTAPADTAQVRRRELVFVANQDSNDVTVFSVDGVTGAHTAAPGSPFAAGERPFDLAITPDGKFLYVCHYGSEDIRGYRVADTGKLTPLPAPASMPTPEALVMAAEGRALYATGADNKLYGFTIDGTTGALHAVTGSPFASITTVQGLAADRQGRHLAVTERTNPSGAGLVHLFDIAADGTLQPAARVAAPGIFAGDSPALAFDPEGAFLYGAITVTGGADRVFGFAVPPPGGAFTPIPGGPWPGVSEGHAFTFHPTRPLMFHAGTAELRIFTRAANGSLSEVSGSPSVAFNNDTGASVSSLGTFLYVLYQSENEVTVSTIAESGLPVPFAGSPWKVGTNPFALVVKSSGSF